MRARKRQWLSFYDTYLRDAYRLRYGDHLFMWKARQFLALRAAAAGVVGTSADQQENNRG